jgi:subtilisin family serine protease
MALVVSQSDRQEVRSKRKPYQVNFLKTIVASGSSYSVLVDTVYISGCADRNQAAVLACEKAVATRGVAGSQGYSTRGSLI